jgi:hypothetical protein
MDVIETALNQINIWKRQYFHCVNNAEREHCLNEMVKMIDCVRTLQKDEFNEELKSSPEKGIIPPWD